MTPPAFFFFISGIIFLALAKAKNSLYGYTSPKPFGISETHRCIEYDIRVAETWLSHLENYTGTQGFLLKKNILELGPGSDIGTGVYLLAKGGEKYNACDINDLVKSTPDIFYEQLFKRLESTLTMDAACLKEEVEKAKNGSVSRLNYLVRDDFDLVSAFGKSTIDLVFSQAAFEHFDDIESTISHLSRVCKSGAVLVAEVDLKTHSRWIRRRDPNNIYRYSERLYNIFRFRGIPNRVRPYMYKEILERCGWQDIKIIPVKALDKMVNSHIRLHKTFSDRKNQMHYLSVVICATKS